MHVGIYRITNVINGKHYIGSSLNVEKRLVQHSGDLERDGHVNPHLQSSWGKYGKNSFTFKILLYCDKKNLLFFEQKAIKEYKTLDNAHGYNCRPAERCDLTGSNYKKWIKRKSDAAKGRKCSPETKKKLSKSHIGQIISNETRKKISKALRGRKISIKQKQKLLKSLIGRKVSDETRKKMSEAQRGAKSHKARPVVADGKQYPAVVIAARDLMVHVETIRRRIKKNKRGYCYVNKKENPYI